MKKKILAVTVLCAALAMCAALVGCGSSSSSSSSSSSDSAAKYKVVASLQDEHYAIAFKKGNDDLAAVVNDTIAQLDKDGKVQELIEKYAEYGMSYEDWCFTAPTTASTAKFDDLTFIVGFDAEYPPYGFVGDDGAYTGFDLDLAQLVCEANGWTFEAQAIDWDAKDALIESEQITCIWNGLTHEGRESEYSFSNDYMLNGQVVVVKADSDIASTDDLADKVVVTQTGSAAQELLEGEEATDDMKALAATFKQLDTVPAYTTAFMNLDSGAADVVICDKSIANTYISGAAE